MDKVSKASVVRSTPTGRCEGSTESDETLAMSSPNDNVRKIEGKTYEHLGLFLLRRRNIERSDDTSFDLAEQRLPR